MNIIEGTELAQFIGALIFLAGILVGSYWFVYAPVKRENRERLEKERDTDSGATSSQTR